VSRTRPPVSVVVPFLGPDTELERVVAALSALATRPGDQLIVADNRTTEPPARARGDGVVVHPAGGLRTPGFARNRGAALAGRPWLVFVDADTEPARSLLDDYFATAPGDCTAVLAGGILDVVPQRDRGGRPGQAARHAVARGHMDQAVTLERPVFAYAQTANCAVRRDAFAAVGGFDESVRAAEDADLCFRLAAAGWRLEPRPGALVAHQARATLAGSLRQLARHGAGAGWCNRRHPGSFPPPGGPALAARLGRSAARALAAGARGDREAAAFAALELAEASAFELGRLLPNRVRR
jgi:GT2 family glycosyltransferase